MDNIETALLDLDSALNSSAPHMRPPVMPNYLPSPSIFSICSSDKEKEAVKRWLADNSLTESEIGFVTAFDYPKRKIIINRIKKIQENEAKLYSISDILQSMVVGSKSDYEINVRTFLELNGYGTDTPEHFHIFPEVYNCSYSMQVILSNVPGFKLYLGEHSLPLQNTDMGTVLSELLEPEKSDKVEESTENGTENVRPTKKRRHKRSKA